MPLHQLGTRARFVGRPGSPPRQVTVEPDGRSKALRAVEITLGECARLGARPWGGHLALSSDIPVGLGMGSSTSDVIAAVRAVAASFGLRLPAVRMAHIAVEAERASDPVMLESRPMLFAQREGRVLELLGDALPPTLVVGCTTGSGRPVDTLALPAVTYRDCDVDDFEQLRRSLRRAVRSCDVAMLGAVSTESARRNQRVHAKPELATLEAIAGAFGAVGIQVAHSGNVAGVLFDPNQPGLAARVRQCMRALTSEGIPTSRVFTAGRANRPRRHHYERSHQAGHHVSGYRHGRVGI